MTVSSALMVDAHHAPALNDLGGALNVGWSAGVSMCQ